MEHSTWKEKQLQRAQRWIKSLFIRLFRVEVIGHYQPALNSVIIANCTSVIDVLLLSLFIHPPDGTFSNKSEKGIKWDC